MGNDTCHFSALGCEGPPWLQAVQDVREVALRPHHQCRTGCGGPTDWPVCSPQRWVCGYLHPTTSLCRTKLGRHLLCHHSSSEPHPSNNVVSAIAFLLDYIQGTHDIPDSFRYLGRNAQASMQQWAGSCLHCFARQRKAYIQTFHWFTNQDTIPIHTCN